MCILCIYMHISCFMNVALDQMYSSSFYLSFPLTLSVFIIALPLVHAAKPFPPWHQSSPCLQPCLPLNSNLQWNLSINVLSFLKLNTTLKISYFHLFIYFCFVLLLQLRDNIFLMLWDVKYMGGHWESSLSTTDQWGIVKVKGIAGNHPTTVLEQRCFPTSLTWPQYLQSFSSL